VAVLFEFAVNTVTGHGVTTDWRRTHGVVGPFSENKLITGYAACPPRASCREGKQPGRSLPALLSAQEKVMLVNCT
jgi:hypothetical protein